MLEFTSFKLRVRCGSSFMTSSSDMRCIFCCDGMLSYVKFILSYAKISVSRGLNPHCGLILIVNKYSPQCR